MSGSPGRPTFTPGWHPSSLVLWQDPAAFYWRSPERHERSRSQRGLRGLVTSSSTVWRRWSPKGMRQQSRRCGEQWTHSSVTRCPATSGCSGGFSPRWRPWPCGTSTAGSVMSTRHVELARASGALAPLSVALNGRGQVATQCGDFETATSLAAEKDVVNEVTGIRLASTCDLLLAGYRGRPAEAIPLFSATIEDAIARGEGLGCPARQLGRSGPPQRSRALRRGVGCGGAGDRGNLPALGHAVGSARTDRGRRENRAGGTCPGSAGAAVGNDGHRGFRLGEGPGGALASAAQRRPGCRALLRRGGRAARPHPAAARARPCPPALRRVAPSRAPAGRRTPPAARRLRPVRRDRRRGLRRARTQGAARHRREGPQAARSTPTPSSPRRRSTSPGWPETGAPTPRSARNCSSAPAPSNGTSARCSPNWASPPAGTSTTPSPREVSTRHPARRRRRGGGMPRDAPNCHQHSRVAGSDPWSCVRPAWLGPGAEWPDGSRVARQGLPRNRRQPRSWVRCGPGTDRRRGPGRAERSA